MKRCQDCAFRTTSGKNETMPLEHRSVVHKYKKFLGLKVTCEGTAADNCRNPLQVQQPRCGERSPRFPEIRPRRPFYLMCESPGKIRCNRDCSGNGDLKEEEC